MTRTTHGIENSNDSLGEAQRVLSLFTVDEVHRFWPQLEEMLDQVPHTWRHWTKEYIYGSILSNALQVWGIGPPPKATLVLFTSINVFPTMKTLTIVWAAGSFEDSMLVVLDAALTKYARLNDCDEIEIRGRLGWNPKLKSLGFTSEAQVWTRRVMSVKLN